MELRFDELRTDRCCEVSLELLQQLRPYLDAHSLRERLIASFNDGYRCFNVMSGDLVLAFVGFRIVNNLASGKYLYINDLVVHESQRNRGIGKEILEFCKTHAERFGCAAVSLDAGFARVDAHRFYERFGLEKAGFSFYLKTD